MHNPRLLMAAVIRQDNDPYRLHGKDVARKMKSVRQAASFKDLSRVRGGSGIGGFSLIELMIVVAIIGFLATLSLPMYREYRIKANISAAKAVLLEAASKEEQLIVQNRTLTTDVAGVERFTYAYVTGVPANDFSTLGVQIPDDLKSSYTFTILGNLDMSAAPLRMRTLPTFQVTATPVAGSIQDGQSTLSINQFGLKLPVGGW